MDKEEIKMQNERLVELTKMNLAVNIITTEIYIKVALKGDYIDQQEFDKAFSILEEMKKEI